MKTDVAIFKSGSMVGLQVRVGGQGVFVPNLVKISDEPMVHNKMTEDEKDMRNQQGANTVHVLPAGATNLRVQQIARITVGNTHVLMTSGRGTFIGRIDGAAFKRASYMLVRRNPGRIYRGKYSK
jgi:hypothetical protein